MPNERDQSVVSKTCRTCLQEKSASQFFSDPKNSDGIKNQCKDCLRDHSRNYSRANTAKKTAYYHRRIRNPAIRQARNDYARAMYRKHKAKHNARTKLEYAVRTGKILRAPCSVCGSLHVQAHHSDYSKPYDVTWLCKLHHAIQHRQYA
jgi:hypothetical protein